MKLKALKKTIDIMVERAGNCDPDVEVWYKEKMYCIKRISQFAVVPDVMIVLGKENIKKCRIIIQAQILGRKKNKN